jgi:predicted dienelactone hydrolase
MHRAALVSLVLISSVLTPASLHADTFSQGRVYKVGIAYRTFKIDGAYSWRGAKEHALTSVIWYPADPGSVEKPQWIGAPDKPLLSLGQAAQDAHVVSSPAKFPMILLSHGTGGSALNMAWLGTVLASHGYIAVAVNHPGNNGITDPYTLRGFSLWWDRATDLSTVIDKVLGDTTFGTRIDPKRIGAAGFSLGGYTMIELAGGTTDLAAFAKFCKSSSADAICKSPPEFPNLFSQIDDLAKTDPDFQQSLRQAGNSYRDPRVRAVFALAPALGPAFSIASLKRISIPVEIVAGAADQNVPIGTSAKHFAANIPGAKLTLFPGAVAHYVFMPVCTEQGSKELASVCTDGIGVNREDIHAKTLARILTFFAVNLK